MLRCVVLSVLVGLMLSPSTVEGHAKYVQLLPNGGNVPDSPNIGHLDAAGETGLSGFGKAFSKAGNAWGPALCQEDTDGDGYTNGQELGDPCCTWTATSTASLVADGISHPSDASLIPTNKELLAGCSSSKTSTTNFTGSGEAMRDVVGTVSPAGPNLGGLPPDDDEDDSSESAVLTAGASSATLSSFLVGAVVAVALVLLK